MHRYSTNWPHHIKLYFFLVAISFSISATLSWALTAINSHLSISLVSISSLTIFAGIFLLFDNFFWRVKPLQKTLLIPNLNGTWNCEGRTQQKNGEAVDFQWEATIKIKQSWTRVRIVMDSTKSKSYSHTASIRKIDDGEAELTYVYDNTPSVEHKDKDMRRHSGTVRLTFSEQSGTASGDYFTDGERNTVGSMRLKKE